MDFGLSFTGSSYNCSFLVVTRFTSTDLVILLPMISFMGPIVNYY